MAAALALTACSGDDDTASDDTVAVTTASPASSSEAPASTTATTTTVASTTTMATTSTEPTSVPRGVEPAVLEGPITVGQISPPADPVPVDLEAAGYVTEEFFASGTASTYAMAGERTTDGRWSVEPTTTAPYRTRFLVRRPADPEAFGGTVIVEWLNVSGVEAGPEWSYTHRAIIDARAAWVGVSVQALGVVGGEALLDVGDAGQASANTGIKGNNPERYGSLEHPGDAYAFDIWTQIGAAMTAPGGVALFGGAEATTVIAAGESQSAGYMTTYLNAIHPMAGVFDGFFVHSRGGSAAAVEGPVGIRGDAVQFRTDLDVPVMGFQTETDIGPLLDYSPARQADTDLIRVWEVAGTAHADAYLVPIRFPQCSAESNAGPQHYVINAAMEAFIDWVNGGDPPPSGEPILIEDGVVVRDDAGNALGGIRTPSVEVPVATISGFAPEGDDVLCQLFGSTTPFDAATLATRYGTPAEYLALFTASLDEAIEAGFVRAADREMYLAEARSVTW